MKVSGSGNVDPHNENTDTDPVERAVNDSFQLSLHFFLTIDMYLYKKNGFLFNF